jgi:hypothetical protein
MCCRAESRIFAASAQVLACAEMGQIEAYVAAHSLTTVFYLIAIDRSADQARIVLGDLLRFFVVAGIDQRTIEEALELPYSDFEDALQMVAAIQAGADYLVTGDVVGLRAGSLRALGRLNSSLCSSPACCGPVALAPTHDLHYTGSRHAPCRNDHEPV